jgi:hypothetical protein
VIDSQELTEHIKAVIKAVDAATKEAGSPHYNKVPDKIAFKLAIVNAKKAEGGIKLWVVNAEGKYEKEEISKIEFEYSNNRVGAFVFG